MRPARYGSRRDLTTLPNSATLATLPPREAAMKNIIILCDGTGNEISENISNVLKFYRCLRKTDKSEPRHDQLPSRQVAPLAGAVTTCSWLSRSR